MSELVTNKIKSLHEKVFSECSSVMQEYLPDLSNTEMISKYNILKQGNEFLNGFFYIDEERLKEIISETVSDIKIYRYFVGLNSCPDEDERIRLEKIYNKYVKESNKIETITDIDKKIKAEKKIEEKYGEYLFYKNDDIISIIATYKILPHPTNDMELFENYKKKTRRLVSKVNIGILTDLDKVKEACKTNRIKYEETWANGIVYFSQMLQ